MDLDEFRDILLNNGVDVWSVIDAAIAVVVRDHRDELKDRRDAIVERLYTTSNQRCRSCDEGKTKVIPDGKATKVRNLEAKSATPETPQFVDAEQDHEDQHHDTGGNDVQKTIIEIKEYLEDPDQTEDSILEILQELDDMDVTFQSLKETDIGRYVNRLRKHSSAEVRGLVKQLIRKWKDIVDKWVMLKDTVEISPSALIYSPQQKLHQTPDSTYSPNLQNENSGSDKNTDLEVRNKIIRKEQSPQSTSLQKRKEQEIDAERLASARKRLQQNYQEAENAKKQRTIQMMDIHEIPKPKNAFFAKNKGFQGRH